MGQAYHVVPRASAKGGTNERWGDIIRELKRYIRDTVPDGSESLQSSPINIDLPEHSIAADHPNIDLPLKLLKSFIMSSTPYIILISGASRGLGKGLVERYLARPNHVVIAANRDPNSSTSKSLHEISKAEGTRLIIVKYDGAADDGASGIPKDLAAEGIDHLDLVIANAGMAYIHPSVSDLKLSDFQNHIATNVYGTVLLYQATLSLLKKAHDPKWVTMGSSAGSITATPPVPNAVYGPSKAAVHWLTRRIDVEEALLTAFVMDPG
jgi:norsolorinic acid ketoreductase